MVAPTIGKYNSTTIPQMAQTGTSVDLCCRPPSERMMPSGVTVSDRKYRQQGYQDSGEKQKPSHEKPPARKDTFGPRAIQMPGTHNVSRCAQCGTVLTLVTEPLGQCAKCGFELHSCKQCTYFDPSQRFECLQPVPKRIPKKDARNECKFYSISVRVEKQTSTGAPSTPNNARKAFDSLFKD